MRAITGALGRRGLRFLESLGSMAFLVRDTAYWVLIAPFRGSKSRAAATWEQMVRAGVRSLPIVCLVLTFVGVILALQMATILKRFGVIHYVGNVVGVAMVRELGPLLTAIVMSGYIGAAVAAEIGTMKVSEEILALETSGVNPIRFLVGPRVIATVVMLPCVTIIGDFVGMAGGLFVAVGILQIDWALYVTMCYDVLEVRDIVTGLVKSVVFGLVVAFIACHRGLTTSEGAEGVGKSTTASVVLSIVFIIVSDCLLTGLFYFI